MKPRTAGFKNLQEGIGVAVSLLTCGPLMAADQPKAIDASQVKDFTALNFEELGRVKVVTATLRETDPFSLPFMTQALTRDDYVRQLPRSLPNWLDGVPGVMVQKTANGQSSPYIRGFTGFRTLLMVDGIRLNNSVFRDGPNQYWNTVDPLSVDHLETVKGPGSVLYGSDAIGGTVNALTIGPSPHGAGPDWNGRATYRFASAENSHIARTEFGASLNEQMGVQLGATYKDFGELRGGRNVGVQRKTDYGEQDFDGKFDYHFRRNVKLTLAHQTVVQDDIRRTHSTIYGSNWEGLTHGSDLERLLDQERKLTYLQFHATELPGFVEEMHLSLSDHVQNEDQFRIRSNRRSEHSRLEVNTLGASLELESPSPVGRWTYGSTYYRDWVDSSTRKYNADGSLQIREIQGPVADDSTYDLLGFFLQNQLPSLGPVDVGIRGRFEHAAANAGKIKDPVSSTETTFANDWNSAVGSARAMLHVDQGGHWNVFGGVGQGFRAPNLSDLTRSDIAGSGQIETPSTTVKPERFMTYETGIKTRYDRFEFEASYFFTDIRDLIIRTPTGRQISGADEVTKQNAGQGFIHGVELQARVRIHPEWTALGDVTWMDGEADAYPTGNPSLKVREPVTRLMPLTSHLALRWEHPDHKFRAEGICTIVARQDQLSSGDISDVERIPPGGTPGYVVWTLRATFQPYKNFSLSAVLENLADKDYRIHGSGINEPGRNFTLQAGLQF